MTEAGRGGGFVFHGFPSLEGTTIPAAFFEVLLARLTDPQMRALLFVMHATLGTGGKEATFERPALETAHRISEATGLPRGTAARACLQLVKKGVLVAERYRPPGARFETTAYRLRMRDDQSAMLSREDTADGEPLPEQTLVLGRQAETVVGRHLPTRRRARPTDRGDMNLLRDLTRLGMERKAARLLLAQTPYAEILRQLIVLPVRGAAEPLAAFVEALRESRSLPSPFTEGVVAAAPLPLPAEAEERHLAERIEGYLKGLSAVQRHELLTAAAARIRAVGGAAFSERQIPRCMAMGFARLIAAERMGLLHPR